MSQKHRDFADCSISDLYRENATAESDALIGPQVYETGTEISTDEVEMDITEDFRALFFSLFYLLQGQFLLPASTIQNIVEEVQSIHELGQTYRIHLKKYIYCVKVFFNIIQKCKLSYSLDSLCMQ